MIAIDDNAIRMVYPSGRAFATCAMPMPPPAPPLFSTMTLCFSSLLSAAATGRATVSATPPGGNGTIIVTGLAGQASSARTIVGKTETRHPASAIESFNAWIFIISPYRVFLIGVVAACRGNGNCTRKEIFRHGAIAMRVKVFHRLDKWTQRDGRDLR